MRDSVDSIVWEEPWERVEMSTEQQPHIQNQLDREISLQHPLYGKGAKCVGRRIDCDDVVAVLSDGSFVNVHLIWRADSDPVIDPELYPSWFSYGRVDGFAEAMRIDAEDYCNAA